MRYLILIAFVFACQINYGQQDATATYSKSIVSTDCWSNNHVIATPTQQNSLAIFENYVYTVYYNADRYLCVSRSNNYGKDSWKTVILSHRYEMRNGVYDNHNTPNIAISPIDKRIHLSFDMHARDLRYMISAENLAVAEDSVFTADKFSAVRNYLTVNEAAVKQVTYPRFIIGKDSTLIFSYRGDGGSGNANSFLVTYKNNGYWNNPIKIVNGKIGTYTGSAGTSSTRCAYFNDFVNKSGVLYLTWMWRETPDLITNHDLMFAYSEDNGTTWNNTNNIPMSAPMHLNSNGIKVATIPQNSGMINHNACAVDGSGNVHAVVRINSTYKHYYRLGTQWKNQVANIEDFAGDRPKLYCDRTTNTLYLMIRKGAELGLFASYPNGDKWDKWTKVKGVSDSYMSSSNSFITDDGKTLRTMAVTSDNELHLITWNLTSYSPQVLPTDTAKVLAFKNIYNDQEIEAGTDLSIEATVGSAFTEVALWSGSTNLGTLSSAPYVWSGHSILTDMNDETYTFILVAKDSSQVEVERSITIKTKVPSANTFTGEGQYKFFNPSKSKWMGYDVVTDDALVTDVEDAEINKFNLVANGDKFNIYTGGNEKVVIINSAKGFTSVLATPTPEVLSSDDALFTLNETASGSELYFITSGAIDPNSGENFKLNVKSSGTDIGRGTNTIPNYQWRVTRSGDLPASNVAPTNIFLSVVSLIEGNAANDTIGMLYASDANPFDTLTYSLAAGDGTNDADNSAFTITDNVLTINDTAVYETKASYNINIKVTDADGLSFDKAFTILVIEIPKNTAPTDIALSATAIDENNVADAVVGTLSATDADAEDTFTFTFEADETNGADNDAFTISGDALSINASADYETKNEYKINIKVADAGGLTFVKAFTVTVNDANEAPTAVTLSSESIAENAAPGTLVGTLSASDVDANSTFTYTLSGADAASFSVVDDSLKSAEMFDYETKVSYSITITVSDGELTFNQDFTISIDDVVETSIGAIELSKVSFYPNPVRNRLTVNGLSVDAAASVYTISGILVKVSQVCVVNNSIDFSELPSGTYIIKLAVEDRELVTKIIK